MEGLEIQRVRERRDIIARQGWGEPEGLFAYVCMCNCLSSVQWLDPYVFFSPNNALVDQSLANFICLHIVRKMLFGHKNCIYK